MGGRRRASDGEVELRLLGPLEARRRGQPLPLGGAKPQAVLVSLALEPGRVVSVDRLIENLWPTVPPSTASHAVQVYVSQLRKTLGTAVISTRANGYVLDVDADAVDAGRFARLVDEGRAALQAGDASVAGHVLRDALDLWRGPALSGFRYEPFTQSEIARLEESRLLAVEERIEADLALDRHVDLVPELEALVRERPLRERLRAQLMLALYRCGRQADALAAYRQGRATLVDELGVEPGPALRELEAAILRQDDALLPATTSASAPSSHRRVVTILSAAVADPLALTEALDAEAVAEILRRFVDAATAAVSRHGGRMERSGADAVTAAFGAPISREDDALRAARAALDVRAAVRELSAGQACGHVAVRIGIETGEVAAVPGDGGRDLMVGRAPAVAAQLEREARPDEIVVGGAAAALIEHAATLEGAGPSRLLGVAPDAAASSRRQDAPFVGRAAELATLDAALKRADTEATAHAALVVGPAGVGKSRLAAEFAARAVGAIVLRGRCLSYGDGITYSPLREALADAPQGNERDALVAALDAPAPPPTADLGLAFRHFCEALARNAPLALVFDDVQWAEPTLLELIDATATHGRGPLLIVCLAREELREEVPGFLAKAPTFRLALDPLADDDMNRLLDELGGRALDAGRRRRMLEAAGGNPFFLEQLLALALEGGGDETLPPSVRALLSARLDRLGPGERAVLERASIVGKEFTLADVLSLLPPDATQTAEAHLPALERRGFVARAAEGAYAFRHVLVQEAVYRAAPKRLRAELHERCARHFLLEMPDLTEVDELAGYHLEQAHRLHQELHELDERTPTLAEEAGARLGAAGVRAFKRADLHAARSLLARAVALLPSGHGRRRELLCEVALAQVAAAEFDAAIEALDGAIDEARESADDRIGQRARIELEYVRLRREMRRPAEHLLDATAAGIPFLERAGDDRALGRAWLLAGYVFGGYRAQHEAWADAAGRALGHYSAAGWPTSTCVGEIAAALYWGPTPIEEGARRCEALLRDEALDLSGETYLRAFLGAFAAHLHDFDGARKLLAAAATALEELGLPAAADTYCTPLLAEVELFAGEAAAAERILRALCTRLEQASDFGHLASRASDLADALVELGAFDEAAEWTRVAERHAAPDDVNAQLMWRPVRARIHAQRRELDAAERLAREGVALADTTDDLMRCAKAHRDLARILGMRGHSAEARSELDRARDLYELKGSLVGAADIRAIRSERVIA